MLLLFMPARLRVGAIVLVISIAIVALDRLALWMEARGWIYWRKVKPKGGGGGGMSRTLTAMQAFVEPEIQHVIEERRQQSALLDDFAGQPVDPIARVTFPPLDHIAGLTFPPRADARKEEETQKPTTDQ